MRYVDSFGTSAHVSLPRKLGSKHCVKLALMRNGETLAFWIPGSAQARQMAMDLQEAVNQAEVKMALWKNKPAVQSLRHGHKNRTRIREYESL